MQNLAGRKNRRCDYVAALPGVRYGYLALLYTSGLTLALDLTLTLTIILDILGKDSAQAYHTRTKEQCPFSCVVIPNLEVNSPC